MRSLRPKVNSALSAAVLAAVSSGVALGAAPDDIDSQPLSGAMSVATGIDTEGLTCFAGGFADGQVVAAEDMSTRIGDGKSFRLFDLSGEKGEVISIGEPRHEGGEGECYDLWRHELSLDPREVGKAVVAIHPPRPATRVLPTVLEVMAEPLPEHVELMRDFLSRRSVPNPEPNIVQAIRTDLEGDGTNDYILNVVRIGEDKARVGDHSIVVLVRGEGRGPPHFYHPGGG